MANRGPMKKEEMDELVRGLIAAWAQQPGVKRLPQKYKGLDQESGVGCRVEHEPSGLWSYCDRWRTFDLNRWHAMKDLAIKMEAR